MDTTSSESTTDAAERLLTKSKTPKHRSPSPPPPPPPKKVTPVVDVPISPPVERTPDKTSEAEERQNDVMSSEETKMEESPLMTPSQAAMDLTPSEQSSDLTPPELIPMIPPEQSEADIQEQEPDVIMLNQEDVDPLTASEVTNITDDIEVHEVE